jgi:NADPH:quinone reductase
MRAIGVTRFGGPEVLQLVDVPPEPLGRGEVRIRVAAAAVNPTDILRRTGGIGAGPSPDEPTVLGVEAAGVLTEVATDVDRADLAPGRRVIAYVRPVGSHGAYREDLVVPAASVVPAPAGVDHVAAATLPMNGVTALLALDLLALRPGQVLAVSGAAGVVGGYTIQLAKAGGLAVVADASAADDRLVRELGADVVVRRGPAVAERIRAHVPDGVDGVVDAALLHEQLTSAVRNGGRFATLRGWAGDGQRGIHFLSVLAPEHAEDTAMLDRLRRHVEAGVLTLRVAGTLPAERATEAHRRLEAGGLRGRLVLTFT